jgi:hypothetical protein
MPVLNPGKAYQLPKKKPHGTGAEISESELIHLVQAAQDYLEPAAWQEFQVHMYSKAAADSAYVQTPQILQGLKIIHNHFLDANATPSAKASIKGS